VRRIVILALAGALAAAACSSPQSSAPPTPPTAANPIASTTVATEAPTTAPPAAAQSVVCQFYPDIEKMVSDAAGQDMRGENSAAATRDAINAIEALATKATNPAEKKDLTTLANAMDSAAMTGGSFSDWDPAFEAFHVKYGPGCGQVVLTPAP